MLCRRESKEFLKLSRQRQIAQADARARALFDSMRGIEARSAQNRTFDFDQSGPPMRSQALSVRERSRFSARKNVCGVLMRAREGRSNEQRPRGGEEKNCLFGDAIGGAQDEHNGGR